MLEAKKGWRNEGKKTRGVCNGLVINFFVIKSQKTKKGCALNFLKRGFLNSFFFSSVLHVRTGAILLRGGEMNG